MSRSDQCISAATKLRAAMPRIASLRAVIGMDGFVDSIIDVVNTRAGFERYTRMETIETFGNKIVAAAGKSANYEFVVTHKKLGGNGPIYADALAIAGMQIDYIGSLGCPQPDAVFHEFGTRARLHSLCEPGYTDALEFADGKLLLGKITQLADVNWQNLVARVGLEPFRRMCDAADLLAMNNWTMLPHLGEIWSHVCEDVLPSLSKKPRQIFIDLADPEKRTVEDLCRDLQTLTRMEAYAQVTLGLNLKEAAQVANVLGIKPAADDNEQIQVAAASIREKLRLSTIVIHPRRGAGAADASGSAWFDGPLVKQPKLSTGAGDNFNAGFTLGKLAGLTLQESLICGCGSSGFYVRQGGSPSAAKLADFLQALPLPEN